MIEIHIFAVYVIGDNCDVVNQILVNHFDEKLDGDDECFLLYASLRWVSIYCSNYILYIIYYTSYMYIIYAYYLYTIYCMLSIDCIMIDLHTVYRALCFSSWVQ